MGGGTKTYCKLKEERLRRKKILQGSKERKKLTRELEKVVIHYTEKKKLKWDKCKWKKN